MIKIYEDNGLPFYDSNWIRTRDYFTKTIEHDIKRLLWQANISWNIQQIESPCLIPDELVSNEYSADDVYKTQDFTLKPETTNASYEYAKYLLDHQLAKPPLCVWQASKSFRRENDQVSANVRLKEFYQLEFQCIYTKDTKKDYHDLLESLRNLVENLTNKKARIIESDRLPHYSESTIDIEVLMPNKWLEIMSSSKRNDVPFSWNDKKLLNTEFAFGLDRLVYAKENK